MEYRMPKPPFEYRTFSAMNKKEAQQYYEWYVGQLDDRITYLYQYIAECGIQIKFDYSVNSLISLWSWYEGEIQTISKSNEEYENELTECLDWVAPYISKTKFTNETIMIGLDVAIYFAEVIIRTSNDKIRWGYFTKPKKRIDVNEPVLLGFAKDTNMNPRRIILVAAKKSCEKKDERRLFDVYHVWKGYVE